MWLLYALITGGIVGFSFYLFGDPGFEPEEYEMAEMTAEGEGLRFKLML